MSVDRLMTQLERMTSIELSATGKFWISPSRNSMFVVLLFRAFSRALSSREMGSLLFGDGNAVKIKSLVLRMTA